MKHFNFKIHENNYSVKIVSHEDNTFALEVNGTPYSVLMKEEVKTSKTPTLVRGAAKRNLEPIKPNPSSSKTKIVAPIPGVILSIAVKEGDVIKEDDLLFVLEAMKMENHITAEKAGKVSAVHIKIGQQVLQDEVLIELE